jgi:5-methylthioribose kinase
MDHPLDIEQPGALLTYLRDQGRVHPTEKPLITVLPGGVSNRTVRVDRSHGESWVIKQALAQLRVKEEWFSDPSRIRRESLGLQWIARLVPWETVPAWAFEDLNQHLLAMAAVPMPHENWKTRLLNGRVDLEFAEAFGRLLGTLHVESNRRQAELPGELFDRGFFETLRVEPYYRFSCQRNPAAQQAINDLIEETLSIQCSLVHGDYSPKNVLIRNQRLVLLDHEVIHVGDPAFDVGFALTHFLAKARHLPGHRPQLLLAARQFWQDYAASASALALMPGFESRVVRHTLACLLARVDGRSPLEYLSEEERAAQRRHALEELLHPPNSLEPWLSAMSVALR